MLLSNLGAEEGADPTVLAIAQDFRISPAAENKSWTGLIWDYAVLHRHLRESVSPVLHWIKRHGDCPNHSSSNWDLTGWGRVPDKHILLTTMGSQNLWITLCRVLPKTFIMNNHLWTFAKVYSHCLFFHHCMLSSEEYIKRYSKQVEPSANDLLLFNTQSCALFRFCTLFWQLLNVNHI